MEIKMEWSAAYERRLLESRDGLFVNAAMVDAELNMRLVHWLGDYFGAVGHEVGIVWTGATRDRGAVVPSPETWSDERGLPADRVRLVYSSLQRAGVLRFELGTGSWRVSPRWVCWIADDGEARAARDSWPVVNLDPPECGVMRWRMPRKRR